MSEEKKDVSTEEFVEGDFYYLQGQFLDKGIPGSPLYHFWCRAKYKGKLNRNGGHEYIFKEIPGGKERRIPDYEIEHCQIEKISGESVLFKIIESHEREIRETKKAMRKLLNIIRGCKETRKILEGKGISFYEEGF